MRRLIVVVGLLAFMFGLTSTPRAAAADFSLGVWQASGSQMWRITFPPDGASELVYPQAGPYLLAGWRRAAPHYTLSAEAGFNPGLQPATGSDTDWDFTQSPGPSYYGEFKTTGTGGFFNLDWGKQVGRTEFFAGYSYRRNHFRITEGLYTIEYYNAETIPLPDLDSSYDIVYQGLRLGARQERRLSPKFDLVGTVAYSPLVAVTGHGKWNLRSLDFTHNGSGQAVDASIGLVYYPQKRLTGPSFTVGYRCQLLTLRRGTESTNAAIRWSRATNRQEGVYFAGNFRC